MFFFNLQSTEYKGEYWANHPTIKIFWEVFHDLPLEKKKQFLCKFDDPSDVLEDNFSSSG